MRSESLKPDLAAAGNEGGSAAGREAARAGDWARLSELLLGETEPDLICDRACRLLVERFGFARSLIALANREGNRLVTRGGYDPAVPRPVDLALRKLFTIPLEPLKDGRHLVAAWCVLRDEQVHVPDAEAYAFCPEETVQRPTLVKAFGTREYVLTPIRGPGGAIGLLAVDRRGSEPAFAPDDLRTLRAVGDLLGLALFARDGAAGAPAAEVAPGAPEERGAARGPDADGVRGGSGAELPEILDVLREGLVLVAPDGTVRYVNRAASSLLDLLPWDVVGRPVEALLPRLDPSSDVDARDSARRDGLLCRFRTPEGRVVEGFEERLNISTLGLRGWRAVSLVDVTERVERERDRDEFVATILHDLAAPLQSVVGFAELLLMGRAGELNETQRDFVRRIEENGWEVSSLIADIRELSELKAGRAALQLERLDPFLLVQQVLQELRDEAGEVPGAASGALINDVPPDLPVLRGDRLRLAKALGCVGRRAVAVAGAEGRVRFAGRWEASRGRVRIEVIDPGADGGLERARRQLSRKGLAGAQDGEGSGLGLLVARVVVEAHGGEIWASGTAGGKTSIVLALPAAPDGP